MTTAVALPDGVRSVTTTHGQRFFVRGRDLEDARHVAARYLAQHKVHANEQVREVRETIEVWSESADNA
jgi:hypothetical protein